MAQKRGIEGREHNPYGFAGFLAGAGVRASMQNGSTHDFGCQPVEHKADIHDLHATATMLHILGINQPKLTYPYSGRNFRVTDVYGTVIKDILS